MSSTIPPQPPRSSPVLMGDGRFTELWSGWFRQLWAATQNIVIALFTATTPGIVPASGGGTTKFLRADGTWDVPAGSGSGTVTEVDTALPITGGPITGVGTIGINNFDSGHAGAVPASGGGTSNFLRADGSWATPPGGGGSGTVTSVSAGDGLSASPSPITGAGTISLQNRFADSLLLMGA